MTRIIISSFFLLLAISSAASAEWCPRHEGRFPAAVVDVGDLEMFYFVPGSIYTEQGQRAIVYLAKRRQLIGITQARGASDWFSSTTYQGETTGFSCDSVTMEFQGAWLKRGNGVVQNFQQGEVRVVDFPKHNLSCLEEAI